MSVWMLCLVTSGTIHLHAPTKNNKKDFVARPDWDQAAAASKATPPPHNTHTTLATIPPQPGATPGASELHCGCIRGLVHAWVAHFVTPLKCTYDKYD